MGRGSCDHVAAQGHRGLRATPRVAPAQPPAAPGPYLALGHPEVHVGLHAGGRAAAHADPHAAAFPPPPACLPGTDVMAGEAAREEEEEPGGVPRPGRARTQCRFPGPRLGAPRARCFRSPSRLLIPAARYHPISQFLAPNAPAARCHRLLTPQIPHFYPLSQSRRNHYSCEPASPQTKSSPPAWPSLGCTGMHLSEAPYHSPCLSFGHDPRNPLCCPLQPSVPGLRIIKTAT